MDFVWTNRARLWHGLVGLRVGLGALGLVAINATLAAAELTPEQSAALKVLGLGLALAVTGEALAGLGGGTLHEFHHIVKALGPLFRSGGLGVFAGVTVVTVVTFNVAAVVLGTALVIGAAAVITNEMVQAYRDRKAMEQKPPPPETVPTPFPDPTPVPTGPGWEPIPGTRWAEITVPDPLPYRGWLPHPPLLAGCSAPGSFLCWDYGFDGVPPAWWWQLDHWPHHPPLSERPPSYTPWWEAELEVEMAEMMLLAESEDLLTLDVLIGPDGSLRGVAARDRGWSPAWDAWLVEAVNLYKAPGDPSLRLGNPYDPAYVRAVTGTTPGSAVPLPASLLMLVTGAAVAVWRHRRIAR